MSPEPVQRCADCGSQLAPGQRYCLACGARSGARSSQLQDLIVRARNGSGGPPDEQLPSPAPAPQEATQRRLRMPVVPIPSPGICALAVLTFLGFGVLMGSAARSSVQDALAASTRSHEKLLVASAPAAAKPSPSTEAPAPGEQAPSSEPEATPVAPATTSSTPAVKTTTASTEGESESSGGESSEKTSTAGNPLTKLPAFRHVFVVMLSDQPYSAVFGPASQAPYLSKTLEKQGELLPHYDAVAHEELANGVALISGQGPTTENAANCPTYTEIAPTGTGELEQVLGSGCVYPQSTKTLPGQLTARNLTWRAYVQGMDETGSASAGCAHPALGQSDPTSGASPGTGTYSTFRNPFMYFHSITSSSSCASDDVGFDHLSQDLASASKTPNLSYVVPDRCHDGNPTPCAPGAPAGLAASETFLRDTVKEITSSKAYKENGLLVITVDEAPATGEFADSSSCCGQPHFPNLQSTTLRPKGGGEVGALLLSPYVKGATSSAEPYNHFSLLRTIEDIFGLSHLGYAGIPQVKPLEPALFVEKG